MTPMTHSNDKHGSINLRAKQWHILLVVADSSLIEPELSLKGKRFYMAPVNK